MTAPPISGKLCPACRRRAAADASLCPMCFRRLDDVEPTELPRRTGRFARVRERADAALAAARRHPRLAVAVALVIALAVFGYLRYVRPPSPLPGGSTAVTAVAAGDSWPGGDGGAGRERASAASPPLEGVIAWSRTFEVPAVTRPVVAADGVYLGLADGRIVALDAGDGEVRWTLSVPGSVDSAPVVVDGTLYLAHRSGRVLALDARTGEERWSLDAGSSVFASPAIADGIVYIASFATLIGADAATGAVLWRRPLDASFIQTAPAVAGGHLLVATNAGVRFFDRHTGDEHYDFALRDAAHVSGNARIALAFRETLYAFDPATERPWWWGIRGAWANFYVLGLAPEVPVPPRRWAASFPSGVYPPVIGEHAVYVAHPGGEVSALDATTGAVRWTRTFDPFTAPPVLTGAGLLAATADALLLIDPEGGELRRSSPLAGLVVDAVAPTDRAIVLQTGARRDGIALVR